MIAYSPKIRVLLVALSLAMFCSPTWATGGRATSAGETLPAGASTGKPRATQRDAAEDRPPTGNAEFGVLLIIGVVAFLIFMAWLLTRVGDDNSPRSDGSLI